MGGVSVDYRHRGAGAGACGVPSGLRGLVDVAAKVGMHRLREEPIVVEVNEDSVNKVGS